MKINRKHIRTNLNKLDKRRIKTLSAKHGLNNEQLIFALELIKTGNATQSYVIAYDKESGSASVRNMARSLKDNPKIIKFNQDLMELLVDESDDDLASPFDILYTLSAIVNGNLLTIDRMLGIQEDILLLHAHLDVMQDQIGLNILSDIEAMTDDYEYESIKTADRINASKLLSDLYKTLNLDTPIADPISDNKGETLSESDIEKIKSEIYGND